MADTYTWQFPLPRTHTGMLLGNGLLGAMVWGEGDTLRITLGRADVWDHRGGSRWNEQMSYANIRAYLDRGEEEKLNELFRGKPAQDGEPRRPSMLPIGMIELHWPGANLLEGSIELQRGELTIKVQRNDEMLTLRLSMLPDSPIAMVDLSDGLGDAQITPISSWQFVGEQLASLSFDPPSEFSDEQLKGWTQSLPADPAYCAASRMDDSLLTLTVSRGETPVDACAAAGQLLAEVASDSYAVAADRAAKWWDEYFQRVPKVEIPNERLQFLYDYGMYKYGGLTNPFGVPATLQGPWVEAYQMPPWSNDYHFNINVQMCYQPGYQGNCLHHMRPLFDMIHSWTDVLRQNAKYFVGVDDGRLLPHAVSDDCVFMVGYWGHSVDHGSTAWVAQMMYRYYRFTRDETFLRKIAYPFMVGALRVYEAMLEADEDGQPRLEIGVSPEYFTPEKRGFGPNASFQLAACHRLLEDVIDATEQLGETCEPGWLQLQKDLPRVCLGGPADQQRIVLWEGQDLDESHRHHSHLAGVTPFDVIDPLSDDWQAIVNESFKHWIRKGAGRWSGWCVPWASMLHSHVGNAEAAELWLEVFDRFYCNEGHGTLHDAAHPGFSLMGVAGFGSTAGKKEVMQMDGGMGAATAVQEMLLHTRRGVTHLFAGAPARWQAVRFEGMRTEGGFLVSSAREKGVVTRVEIKSELTGCLRLANCFEGDATLSIRSGSTRTLRGDVLEIPLQAGDSATLAAAKESR